MAIRFAVLGSGSSGNASLLHIDGRGLLIDIGFGPRQLAARLMSIGFKWECVQGVLLTHTHGDHWRERTLAKMHACRIPLYCHADHIARLEWCSNAFSRLQENGLVRTYARNDAFQPVPGFSCRAIEVRHDSGATFGFRVEPTGRLWDNCWSLGYAADLGTWDDQLADAFCDVDCLALEFNHDVNLQRSSGRAPVLIERVLSDEGHLSNEQAAALLSQIVEKSTPGRLRHVVQLHLSRDCNRPSLAAAVLQAALRQSNSPARVHTSQQDRPLLIQAELASARRGTLERAS